MWLGKTVPLAENKAGPNGLPHRSNSGGQLGCRRLLSKHSDTLLNDLTIPTPRQPCHLQLCVDPSVWTCRVSRWGWTVLVPAERNGEVWWISSRLSAERNGEVWWINSRLSAERNGEVWWINSRLSAERNGEVWWINSRLSTERNGDVWWISSRLSAERNGDV